MNRLDFNILKQSAQLLGFRLKKYKLLTYETTLSWYCHQKTEFTQFFEKENFFIFYSNIFGFIEHIGMSHKAYEWKLHINSPSISLKLLLFTMETIASVSAKCKKLTKI